MLRRGQAGRRGARLTARTSVVEEPAELRDDVVARLRAAVARSVSTPRPAAPRTRSARLLALVPYLHARDAGAPRRGAAASASRRADRQGPRRAVHVRPARRLPRRPHRRRPRRARGPDSGIRRGRHPDLQRRLPRPAAAADTDRGDRDHRRAARAAGRRGGPRRARSSTARWPSSRPPLPAAPPLVEPGEDEVAETSRLRASLERAVGRRRQVRLTYYVPARDEESERVVDPRGVVTSDGVGLPRRLVPQRRGAPAVPARPDPRGHRAGLRGRHRGAAPRDLSDGLFQRSEETTVVTLRLAAPGPLGGGVLPGRGRQAAARTAPSRSTCGSADERWLQRLLMRLGAVRTWSCRRPVWTPTSATGTANSQPVRARRMTNPA